MGTHTRQILIPLPTVPPELSKDPALVGFLLSLNRSVEANLNALFATDYIHGQRLSPGSVDSLVIAEGAITETEITDGSITTPKLAANAVIASKILAGTITGDRLVADTINSREINANAITASELAATSVNTGHLVADSVTVDIIAANAVEADQIKANAVTTDKIIANAVTAAKIDVTDLAAINADMGTITAGSISAERITSDTIHTDRLVIGDLDLVSCTDIGTGIIDGKMGSATDYFDVANGAIQVYSAGSGYVYIKEGKIQTRTGTGGTGDRRAEIDISDMSLWCPDGPGATTASYDINGPTGYTTVFGALVNYATGSPWMQFYVDDYLTPGDHYIRHNISDDGTYIIKGYDLQDCTLSGPPGIATGTYTGDAEILRNVDISQAKVLYLNIKRITDDTGAPWFAAWDGSNLRSWLEGATATSTTVIARHADGFTVGPPLNEEDKVYVYMALYDTT